MSRAGSPEDGLMTRRFKITVAYDGTDFVGWQVQPNGPTLQVAIEKAIRKLTGEETIVTGSGRTDAGVHALGQVAAFSLENWKHPAIEFIRGLNRFLPESIVVLGSVEVHKEFHPIYDATGKRYRYQLLLGGPRNPFLYPYTWQLFYDLDFDAMDQAAKRLVGRQDFACFQASRSNRKTTVRDLRACDVILRKSDSVLPVFPPAGTEPYAANFKPVQRIDIEVEADGFLYNMVRNIVGSLILVGRGVRPPQWIDELIQSGDRKKAGQTAPPDGLFLLRVDYPPIDEDGAHFEQRRPEGGLL